MKYNEGNTAKSNTGNRCERKFTKDTGLEKVKDKDKARFTNSHGIEQIVDYDFYEEVDGVDVFFDLTTSYRSDRAKQKAYNGFMYKTYVDKKAKFYMVVENFVENGKKKNPKLIEGLDDVIEYDDAVKMVKKD